MQIWFTALYLCMTACDAQYGCQFWGYLFTAAQRAAPTTPTIPQIPLREEGSIVNITNTTFSLTLPGGRVMEGPLARLLDHNTYNL